MCRYCYFRLLLLQQQLILFQQSINGQQTSPERWRIIPLNIIPILLQGFRDFQERWFCFVTILHHYSWAAARVGKEHRSFIKLSPKEYCLWVSESLAASSPIRSILLRLVHERRDTISSIAQTTKNRLSGGWRSSSLRILLRMPFCSLLLRWVGGLSWCDAMLSSFLDR